MFDSSCTSHRLTLDLWLVKDNRFLNPKSSYERILTAPPCHVPQIQTLPILLAFYRYFVVNSVSSVLLLFVSLQLSQELICQLFIRFIPG